jgi:hypothetical protein
MNNINTLRIIALITAFTSGAFAHYIYFKPNKDMVQLQRTDSGLFVLSEGHIYSLDKLEVTRDEPTPTYSEGASQSYIMPYGKKK